MKVQLFITCLSEQFFPGVLEKMVMLLDRLGVESVFPEDQICCGQPFFNSGFQTKTRSIAKQWIKVFRKNSLPIVSPSGSCVDMIHHHYPELFKGLPEESSAIDLANNTFEFSQFLVDQLKVTDVGAIFPHKVTYHPSCHLLRGLGIQEQPRKLLRAVKGLELIPLEQEENCCGFGGTFSVIYPEVSRSMMQQKINNIEAADVEAVVACDSGCLMNIAGGLRQYNSKVKALHLIEVLASEETFS